LPEMGLVAFVADGSLLPRRSGISDLPLPDDRAVRFRSPDALRLEVDLPHRGRVTGMGVREGVTLIAGGGFHGKSTLLEALSLGIYPHVPGDGRELVASRPDTVKVCAEDGRRVENVNISAFISNLPGGIDTTRFSTENASGSTSQASYIIESVEMGAGAFLIDEDISATNFLIRDARMQRLIAKEKEPITPYIDMVRPLYENHGISTVLVLGGAGDYFDVADTVIAMEEFLPMDVTTRAHEIASEIPTPRLDEGEPLRLDIEGRRPDPRSLDPGKGGKPVIKCRGLTSIQLGRTDIDLWALMQLNDRSQTRAICGYLRLLPRELSSSPGLRDAIEAISGQVEQGGLDALSQYPGEHPGDIAYVRGFEVAGAVNRLRSLGVLDK
ncbi:MAG: ABC-ATPase domain-containing protein, partial [Actinobacteria bacterium]|nr:ABC-ATPase domain-containing protein [Actinomycetota bacterium]